MNINSNEVEGVEWKIFRSESKRLNKMVKKNKDASDLSQEVSGRPGCQQGGAEGEAENYRCSRGKGLFPNNRKGLQIQSRLPAF